MATAHILTPFQTCIDSRGCLLLNPTRNLILSDTRGHISAKNRAISHQVTLYRRWEISHFPLLPETRTVDDKSQRIQWMTWEFIDLESFQ